MTYKPYVLAITFTGSAQRLIATTETNAARRFSVWATVEAHEDNADRCYIGDSSVAASLYSTSLAANEMASIGGPEYAALGAALHGKVDLTKVYIVGTAAEKAMLTIFVPDEG